MRDLFFVFLRLGTFGFGGPLAAVNYMENEAVNKRRWITEAEFTEIYGVLKLIPGPLSTQMAIYLGRHRYGFLGGMIAGLSYILPSFLIILFLGYYYQKLGPFYGRQEFLGFQVGAIATIFITTLQITRKYLRNIRDVFPFLLSSAVVFYRPSWELGLILLTGSVGSILWCARRKGNQDNGAAKNQQKLNPYWVILFGLVVYGIFQIISNVMSEGVPGFQNFFGSDFNNLLSFFWVCFKAGAFVFGSGLAIIPFLENDLVLRQNWITSHQFLDGLVLGQMTPGPIVMSVSFFGYVIAGFPGALVGTFGIFLAPFINILSWFPLLLKWLKKSQLLSVFISCVMPVILGGILGTIFRLIPGTINSVGAVLLFGSCLGVFIFFHLTPWLLIPLSGAIQYCYIRWVSGV